jgi:hypothetical protein
MYVRNKQHRYYEPGAEGWKWWDYWPEIDEDGRIVLVMIVDDEEEYQWRKQQSYVYLWRPEEIDDDDEEEDLTPECFAKLDKEDKKHCGNSDSRQDCHVVEEIVEEDPDMADDDQEDELENQLKALAKKRQKEREEQKMDQERGNMETMWCVGNFDRVEKPEDLEPRSGISINAPSPDGRCDCCGRHIRELTPFGGPGDPLAGDFSGALLVKKYRRHGPYDEEAMNATDEAQKRYKAAGYADSLEWMRAKYGEEKGEQLYFAASAYDLIGKSWECRDCAVLDSEEYFERRRIRLQEEQKQEQAARQSEESDPR